MKKKRLLPDPYGAEIWFLFGTAKELNAFQSKRHGADIPPMRPDERGSFCVWTPNDPTSYPIYYISVAKDAGKGRFDWVSCLAHETIHLVFSIFDNRGIRYNGTHDEAFAYYYEWLFRQCLKEVW